MGITVLIIGMQQACAQVLFFRHRRAGNGRGPSGLDEPQISVDSSERSPNAVDNEMPSNHLGNSLDRIP